MPVYKRVGGAWVATTMKRKVSGAFANATSVKRRSGGVWLECLAALVATPSSVSGLVFGAGSSGTVTSDTTTITGNVGAVSWAYLSGDNTMTCSSPASTTANWSATVNNGVAKASVWRCTNGSNTVDVPITLERESNA